jgi:hypothetical protein
MLKNEDIIKIVITAIITGVVGIILALLTNVIKSLFNKIVNKIKIIFKNIYKQLTSINTSIKYINSKISSKRVLLSATKLLKMFKIQISTQEFNKLLLQNGIIEDKEVQYNSKNNKKIKLLKNLYYGENIKNEYSFYPETQPLFYKDKFNELLIEIKLK